MKTLYMIFEFFSKNKISTLFVILIYTITLFVSNYFFATARYINYTKDLFTNTEDEDSLYCMLQYDEMELYNNSNSSDPEGELVNKVEKDAKKYKAYTPFSTVRYFNTGYNGVRLVSYLFTPDMIDKYKINLSSGSWNNINEDDEYFPVIVSGYYFEHLNVGDITEVSLYSDDGDNNTKIKVKVAGVLAAPYIIPKFSVSGTLIDSSSLYQRLDGMIFAESDNLMKIMKKANCNVVTSENFITSYKKNSTQYDKDEYLSYLKSEGLVLDYNKILNNSINAVDNSFRKKLPTPFFLLLIITIMIISLSVLFVNKKIREHSIYYLCGCDRRKSYFIISCAIGLMGLLGGLLNILFIVNYDFLTSNGIINMSDGLIYDGQTVLFTLLYALAVSAVSVIISILVFRKSSPIEIYRKYES